MSQSIVILTDAGISQESGIKTFRDSNGLWENHRIEDVASPEGFIKNPALVHDFYNMRRKQLLSSEVKPNVAHRALAELESKWPNQFLLVTQNVDNLHERAGSQKMLHMHGELLKIRCQSSEKVFNWESDLSQKTICSCCQREGQLRPHIVWFGEMPLYMDPIVKALEQCDVFVSIGTSGQVYPAAGFVDITPKKCKKIEINTAETPISESFHEHWIGSASQRVPELLKMLC